MRCLPVQLKKLLTWLQLQNVLKSLDSVMWGTIRSNLMISGCLSPASTPGRDIFQNLISPVIGAESILWHTIQTLSTVWGYHVIGVLVVKRKSMEFLWNFYVTDQNDILPKLHGTTDNITKHFLGNDWQSIDRASSDNSNVVCRVNPL